MNNPEAKPGSSRIGSLTDSIADWVRAMAHKDRSSSRMRLDEDPNPATYSLRSLDERPVFLVDEESSRAFALLDDLGDRGEQKSSAARPQAITESESEKTQTES
jgi:hypothetical protein